MVRLLIVEGDEAVRAFLCRNFEAERYVVDAVSAGSEAQALADARNYELVILDLDLPQNASLEVLKHFRSKDRRTPVLVLASGREVEDRVRALDLGADDLLPKPFAFSELAARARAVLRRAGDFGETVLRVDDLELHRVRRTARRGGRHIELTPKELALLEYLMENAGRCVTRAMIIEHVWKLSPDTVSNVVDVYINYLRKKIDDGSPLRIIRTLRGAGYMMGAPSESP